MNEELETRYRRLIRWYPKSWRRYRGDSLIGTLLDVAEFDNRTVPVRGERFSIARHGVATRMDAVLTSEARGFAASLAIGAGFGYAVAAFLFSTWSPWSLENPAFTSGSFAKLGSFYDLGAIPAIAWTLTFLAGLLGARRAGRLLAVVSALASLAGPVIAHAARPGVLATDRVTAVFLVGCAIVAILGTPHGSRWTAIAGGVGILVGCGLYWHDASVSAGAWSPTSTLWESPGLIGGVIVAALVGAVVLALLKRWVLAGAVVLIAFPWALALTTALFVGDTVSPGFIAFLLMGLEALAVFGLIVRTHRTYVARLDNSRVLDLKGIR